MRTSPELVKKVFHRLSVIHGETVHMYLKYIYLFSVFSKYHLYDTIF